MSLPNHFPMNVNLLHYPSGPLIHSFLKIKNSKYAGLFGSFTLIYSNFKDLQPSFFPILSGQFPSPHTASFLHQTFEILMFQGFFALVVRCFIKVKYHFCPCQSCGLNSLYWSCSRRKLRRCLIVSFGFLFPISHVRHLTVSGILLVYVFSPKSTYGLYFILTFSFWNP